MYLNTESSYLLNSRKDASSPTWEALKGTFVNVDSLNIKVHFNPCMEFSQMIRNSGYEPSVKLGDIKKIPRDEAICGLLHMKEDEELVIAEKIRESVNTGVNLCVKNAHPAECAFLYFTAAMKKTHMS